MKVSKSQVTAELKGKAAIWFKIMLVFERTPNEKLLSILLKPYTGPDSSVGIILQISQVPTLTLLL